MRSYRRFASVYDRLMEDMPYSEWMNFARRSWEKYGMPKTVVDLACGTGNVSIPLAKAGFSVFGIDLSADMLAIARSKWESGGRNSRQADEPGTIRWLQQDMRDWELPVPVDAVLCFCDSLNYLTEKEDVTATFRRTFDSLAPGGLFLFDVHAPKQLERYAEEQPFVLDEKDVAYLWTSDYDPVRQEIEHDLTFFVREDADGAASGDTLYRRFEESHTQRAYEPDWLAGQLQAAGFELLHLVADFTWTEPNADSERLFYVARKPG
ncbi:class I SAM-dependent methyltransferase [Cohnella lubricantis]|uniref:Class I SAM-dependent methyltransferase n=1 Tax=Cohnella lubricantis TaxID=2163172 RepID=A0A841T6M9_9BACL|nr:class I SAM-dependent methyltransferase [Cohnella lubricantis]MBB6675779.1 class I SAM-dependent methyltransferase [Cohnella lubricantis]MBP2119854.1 SAM-dependent methyltransferase [Cohnella lubricantis]